MITLTRVHFIMVALPLAVGISLWFAQLLSGNSRTREIAEDSAIYVLMLLLSFMILLTAA